MRITQVPEQGDLVLLRDGLKGSILLSNDDGGYKVPSFDVESDTDFWLVDLSVPGFTSRYAVFVWWNGNSWTESISEAELKIQVEAERK